MFTGYKILPELLSPNIDIVILSVGINDLQFQYNVSFEDIKNGISELISLIKNKLPNIKIILIAPTELTDDVLKSPIFASLFDKTSIEKSKNLAEIYYKISKEQKCDFIDLNNIVTPSKFDGLHFEACEHEKIAKEIFKHLM